MRIQTLRRTSQTIVLAITLLGLVGIATTGFIYPYFFCYSCPWDVGACPLGIMEHGFIDFQTTLMSGLSTLLYLFGFLSLLALFFGRAFCAWACPIGALQNITRKLGISKRVNDKLKPNVGPRWKHVKFLMLLSIPVTSIMPMPPGGTRSGRQWKMPACPRKRKGMTWKSSRISAPFLV